MYNQNSSQNPYGQPPLTTSHGNIGQPPYGQMAGSQGNIGQPPYGQMSNSQGNIGQSQYGQKPPQYGQQPSQYGQQPPQYGQQPPQYGQQSSQYGQQSSQYGQQPPQYGQQPPQYGQQPPQYGQQPPQYGQSSLNSKVQVISRGKGINDKEFNDITSSCIEVQDKKVIPMSNMCIKKIKEKLRGEWYVFVVPEKETNYDFYLSFVDGGKYLTFKYDLNEFHVCGISV